MSEEEIRRSLSSLDISGVEQKEQMVRKYDDGSHYKQESSVDMKEKKEEKENSKENVTQFSCNSTNDHGISVFEALKQKHERHMMKLRANIMDAKSKMFLFECRFSAVLSDVEFIRHMTQKVRERIGKYDELMGEQEQDSNHEEEEEQESEEISKLDEKSM